jgi:hypothetical protein
MVGVGAKCTPLMGVQGYCGHARIIPGA